MNLQDRILNTSGPHWRILCVLFRVISGASFILANGIRELYELLVPFPCVVAFAKQQTNFFTAELRVQYLDANPSVGTIAVGISGRVGN